MNKNKIFFAACVMTFFSQSTIFGMQNQQNLQGLRNEVFVTMAGMGSLSVVQGVIASGTIDLNVCVGQKKDTALIAAARGQHEEVVPGQHEDVIRALIQAGADVNAQNACAESALTVAGEGMLVGKYPDYRYVFTEKQLSIIRMLFEADVSSIVQKSFIRTAAIKGSGVLYSSVKMVHEDIIRKVIGELEMIAQDEAERFADQPPMMAKNLQNLKNTFEQTKQMRHKSEQTRRLEIQTLLTGDKIKYIKDVAELIADYAAGFEPVFELEPQPQPKKKHPCLIQ